MSRVNRERNSYRRSGYVLVMTVMLLAVTVLIVAGIARHSMTLATIAKQKETKLKEKWAVASAQRFYLKNGQRFLGAVKRGSLQLDLELSGLQIRNTLQDESAKLDVNALAGVVSDQELVRVLRDMAGREQLVVKLRPMPSQQNDTLRNGYEAWGQVFESRDYEGHENLHVATQNLTLWGSRINFRYADEEVLRQAIKSAAGSIMADRFIDAMSEQKEADLGQLLVAIDANDRQSRILSQLLSDRSWATSLHSIVWDGNKSTNYFVIQQRPVENINRYQTYSW